MSDLISRQDAINNIIEVYEYEFPTASGAFDEFVTAIMPNILRNIPSAQPEQKWIPVTKALPENDDWVIVSIYDDDGDTSWQYTTPGFYVPYGKCWIVDNEYCKNVIAWMQLPESYKGD